MSHIILTFLFLLITTSITTTANNPTTNFIQQQCQGTLYFKLCVKCLTKYTHSTLYTPADIARIAMRVSLVKARSAQAYINRVANHLNTTNGEYQSVKDCLAQITEGVEQIARSLAEFTRLAVDDENEFNWHQSNVLTWLSTASTDTLACMNGFPGHAIGNKTKRKIRAKVLNVAELTSNALALVHSFVRRRHASRIVNKP